MIRYTTSDLIERAKELADLQNSDFITWGENMHLLDESYKKLYQEVINANDKYYLQQVRPKDLTVAERTEKEVRYYLPDDFYQLQGIVVENQGMPILKKALTESYSALRYDIIGNTLALYGGVESRGIVINYYPVPKTLTLKAPEVQVSVEGLILDCNESKYLTYSLSGTTATFHVYSIANSQDRTYTVNVDSAVQFALLGRKAVVFKTTSEVYELNLITGEATTIDDAIPGKKDNEVYLLVKNGTVYDLYKAKNLYSPFKESIELTVPAGTKTFTFFADTFYFNTGSVLYRGTENIGAVTSEKMSVLNDDLFFINDDVYVNSDILVNEKDFESVIGFNKVDFNTGYGVSTTSLDDEYVHVHSCFNDTALDFPSNFYFTFIAYQMAIAYKAKQNADASALMTRSGEEAAQFFDSISRDAAECQRIQNVYTVGGIF